MCTITTLCGLVNTSASFSVIHDLTCLLPIFIACSLMSVGEAHSLKIEKILFKGKSKYQEILVF